MSTTDTAAELWVTTAAAHPASPDQELVAVVLEDFKPAAESLLWRVGQAYWGIAGESAFTTSAVPHLVTNNGILASQNARLLFDHCVAQHEAGTLPDSVEVMEMGVGLGVHARLLLTRFSSLCEESGHDFYHRLTYYVTDYSEKSLRDIRDRETLAPFKDHVALGRVDALEPKTFARLDSEPLDLTGRLTAVFCNYLLAVLPFSVIQSDDDGWYALEIRTNLFDVDRVQACLDEPVNALLERVQESDDPASALSKVYSHVMGQRRYASVELEAIPYGAEVESFTNTLLRPLVRMGIVKPEQDRLSVLDSFGAIDCLTRCLDLLVDTGYIVFADYGYPTLQHAAVAATIQNFGGSTAMGLNFPFISHVMKTRAPEAEVVIPERDDEMSLHLRMVRSTRGDNLATKEAFNERFSFMVRDTSRIMINLARKSREVGAIHAAITLFEQAHRRFPEDWLVLEEWAAAATYGLGEPEQGLELARKALEINPLTRPSLWCTLSDALYELKRYDEAKAALYTALDIDPTNVRAFYGLGWIYTAQGRYAEALRAIGMGLAHDRTGELREKLLKKQEDILERQTNFYNAEQTRISNRFE